MCKSIDLGKKSKLTWTKGIGSHENAEEEAETRGKRESGSRRQSLTGLDYLSEGVIAVGTWSRACLEGNADSEDRGGRSFEKKTATTTNCECGTLSYVV